MKISKKSQKRRDAIHSGVANAVDTVFVDKAMTRDEAYASLKQFVSDGLSCYGLDDIVTDADMQIAKSMWPI